MPKRILVIEDDAGIQMSLKDELESEGYAVSTAGDGERGMELVRQENPDLVILDVMLPLLDGYEVCKTLRAEGIATPLIMLTVKDREIDRVLGLELGADDYVTKPFSLRELVARVRAHLRRTEDHKTDCSRCRIADIDLDFKKFEATKSGAPVELTALEFQILKLLVHRKDEGLTRDDFLDAIWGEGNVQVTARTIDTHIANIRKKIEDDPTHPKIIRSIRGVGYRLCD